MRWGILGTGRIAGIFAADVGPAVVAVGSRAQATADAFAAQHGVAAAYGSYDDLLADGGVDAVYISTPHPHHLACTLAAAKAGKHVLVEKPIALNEQHAVEMIDAAQRHDVFLMEAFMYRCHPQIDLVTTLLADGAIGDVRLLTASFGFRAPFDPHGRLFDPALGGGGILDVGCYPASMAILVARTVGAALDADVVGHAFRGQTGVDEWAAATVRFENGLVAQLSCAVSVALDDTVRIFGTRGSIVLPRPWLGGGTVVLHRAGRDDEVLHAPASAGPYALEVAHVAAHVEDRQAPAMPWNDSLATMHILDQWRADVGVRYPGED